MAGTIATVQIEHQGAGADEGADDYWGSGLGGRLLAVYGELLGMEHIDIGYHKLVYEDARVPELGFEHAPGNARPRWPSEGHPQQVHLDVEVADLEAAIEQVVSNGASVLRRGADHVVIEDPVGHPFCLYPQPGLRGSPGRIARVVFDCADPGGLATFYEAFLDMSTRIVDEPDRVEIAGEGHEVHLAFQLSAGPPPRWPDPAHPAQLHLDLDFEEPTGAVRAEELGATRQAVPNRPDHFVYRDPAGHPFCLGVADPLAHGVGQVEYFERLASGESD